MNDKQRIDELESRLAFQDDTIEQLNRSLTAQQRRLETAERQLAILIEHTRKLSQEVGVGEIGEEPPPPHY